MVRREKREMGNGGENNIVFSMRICFRAGGQSIFRVILIVYLTLFITLTLVGHMYTDSRLSETGLASIGRDAEFYVYYE